MHCKYIAFPVAMIILAAGLSACQRDEEQGRAVVSASDGGTAVAVNNGTIVTGGRVVSDQVESPSEHTVTGDTIVQSSSGAGSSNIVVSGSGTSTVDNGDSIVQFSSRRHSSNVVIINGQVVTSNTVVKASGPDKTEERVVRAFDSVSLEVPADAVVTVGPKPSVTITGAQNILPLVRTDVRGGKLTVSIKGSVAMERPLKVVIFTDSLRSAKIEGSATLKLTGITGESLDLGISGSGRVEAEGHVKRMHIDVSGSGQVDAASLRTNEVATSISGSARVSAFATEVATVDLSGSGTVSIAGNPTRRSVDRSGSGQVHFE